MFLKKCRTAVRHPGRVVGYVRWKINCHLVSRVEIAGQWYHRYGGDLYPDYLAHGNACAFIKDTARIWCQGKGLDIGAGDWPLDGAIPVRDTTAQNAYSLDGFDDSSLDYVFSSHCLEHLEHWPDALQLWIGKIRLNGILFLYLPHPLMKLWKPGGPWVASSHKWIPSIEILLPFLKSNGMEIVDYNPGKDSYWSFHVVGRRRIT